MVKTNNQKKYHSIKINKQKCIGCVRCMKDCPTKAIRVRRRKAVINYRRCIDCGECLRVCPYDAVEPITTPSADMKEYKYRIALPSPVLYTQFGPHVMPNEILSVIQELDFEHVYDEALMCEMVSMAIEEYLDEHTTTKPIISSTCPVVVRLIQRLFPSLCDLIIPIEPPRETAAKNLRKEISERHSVKENEIGIFHITPCAAKMVSINHPESMKRSYLDGAISISDIYNSLMMKLKHRKKTSMLEVQRPISGIGIGWTISGGEIRALKYFHSVSVSGVYDTIRILGDIEAGRLKDIQYLECLICPDGCIGGPLTVANRFIAQSNALRLRKVYGEKRLTDTHSVKRLYKDKFFSFEHSLKPKPFPGLDSDRTKALEKLKQKENIIKQLPGTDCGVCGSPDCRTFAEDVVRKAADIRQCMFYKKK